MVGQVGFTNESAVFLHPIESEIGKPDQDSLDGDQPDSGIEETVDSNTKQVLSTQ